MPPVPAVSILAARVASRPFRAFVLAVAEFVEDEAIVEILRHIGVDYAQGYHIGEPCPLAEALEALEPPVRFAA